MANKSINIQTPRGQIIKQKSKNGKSNAVLQWAPNFGRKHTEQFSAAQRYVDQAVLRLSDPLIPILCAGASVYSNQLFKQSKKQ